LRLSNAARKAVAVVARVAESFGVPGAESGWAAGLRHPSAGQRQRMHQVVRQGITVVTERSQDEVAGEVMVAEEWV
jgi:hypothetical protein